jgi:hypothetical protein
VLSDSSLTVPFSRLTQEFRRSLNFQIKHKQFDPLLMKNVLELKLLNCSTAKRTTNRSHDLRLRVRLALVYGDQVLLGDCVLGLSEHTDTHGKVSYMNRW